MRGRFLFPAFFLLALVTPVQAALPVADSADPCVDPDEDPEHMVEFAEQCTFSWLQQSCLADLASVDCSMSVSVQRTEANGTIVTILADQVEVILSTVLHDGDLALQVVVAYAEYTNTFVVECTDLPTFPVRTYDASCAPTGDLERWMA